MKNRIIRTFSGYLLAILIPIIILVIQGMNSLELRRQQIEANLLSELERPKNQLFQDLFFQWIDFLERERSRPFSHYRPVIIPEKASIYAPDGAVQRSPLYDKVDQLVSLSAGEQLDFALNSGDRSSDQPAKPREIFDRALIGYFEFDPTSGTLTTPYDPTETFDSQLEVMSHVTDYHAFLRRFIISDIRDRLQLEGDLPIDPSSLLLRLKTRRINKVREPISKIRQLAVHEKSPFFKPSEPMSRNWIDISYYDFGFETVSTPVGRYVYGVRPVLLGSHIRLQGLVFSLISLLQETQAYLEPLQPKYGSVVVSPSETTSQPPFFEPFQELSISFDVYQDQYLENYRAEMNRFWLTIAFLSLTLLASLAHMYLLLRAEKNLLEQKDNFVSAVTHELKAPLTSIQMYAEMLEEGWARGKEKTYYRYIHAEAKRLGGLVRNILDFARIERGKLTVQLTEFDLPSLISDTIESWRFWIEEHDFKIEFDFRCAPSIRADPEAIIQVIYNLCDNAVKYARTADDPTLTIRVDADEDEAILVFADNGPGIPRDDENKIFHRFYRCETELTREHTGTGLGLALVKEIVEKNGGTITLAPSHEGVTGLAVEMRFPRVDALQKSDS